jgi:hypothetical protein
MTGIEWFLNDVNKNCAQKLQSVAFGFALALGFAFFSKQFVRNLFAIQKTTPNWAG